MRPGEETTVEQWEERFRLDVKRRPGWSVLPIEMLFSQAYRSLSGSAQLALQFALSQVSWEKTRRPGKRKNLKNDTIYLPTNALIALGIKSGSTRTALRKELVEKGFLDVKKSGSYLNCGIFKISGRWRNYPYGEYKPQDQPPPGLSMGHRFKGPADREESSKEIFLRSEIERKRGSKIERKGSAEKTPEGDLLRLKIERKPLRSEIERTVLCTMAEQSYDEKKVLVQYREGEEEENLSRELVLRNPILDTPSITQDVPTESIRVSLRHEWFLDAFKDACNQKGIDSELKIDPCLASSLDDWLDNRLNKRSYVGNRAFHDETSTSVKEKLSEIIAQWQFIEISYLGERVQIPPFPDLSFLVDHREALFGWVSELRQRQTDLILDRLSGIGMQA